MHFEVQCKGCQARYRLKEEFAGRIARCKHCGTQFRVPYRSRVVGLDDEDAVVSPPDVVEPQADSAADTNRNFEEYGVRERKRPRETAADQAVVPILPPIAAELWVPLGLAIFCYGLSLWMSIDRMLGSTGPVAGTILVGIMATLYLAFIIPMTMRTLESAAKTVEFELPNAIWLQTTALIGMPTLGGTIGFFGSGVSACIVGLVIGLVLMMPVMMFWFQSLDWVDRLLDGNVRGVVACAIHVSIPRLG